MSKQQQNKTAREMLLSHVAGLTKKIEAASEDEIKAWAGQLDADNALKQQADQAAAAEKDNAQQSTGVDAAGAADDQNARANDNWPSKTNMAASLVELARRDAKTASLMLAKAKELMAGDEEEECAGCQAAAQQLVAMATNRSKTASTMMQMANSIVAEEDDDDEEGEEKSLPPWLEKNANAKVAARLVTLAKQMMADDEAGDEEEVEDDDDDSGKVAAAIVELAKTLSNSKD
jgi:hypothetical protein